MNFLLLVSKNKSNSWRWVIVRKKPEYHGYSVRNWHELVVGALAIHPETISSPENYYVDADDYFIIEMRNNAAR